MLNSFYSGVSGLKGFQTKLDVIGNNISNVSTTGFKKSRVVFQDFFNTNLSNAIPATTNPDRGGINAKQIGLGTRIASIDTVHTPGSPVTTNIGTDLAIDGDAYFVLVPSGDNIPNIGTDMEAHYLTKAGNFNLDSEGYLVNSNGYFVVGITENAGVMEPHKIQIRESITKDADGNPLPPVKLTSYSFDIDGNIVVVDEDGNSGKLAFDGTNYYLNDGKDLTKLNEIISLATKTVPNTSGLQKAGNSMFLETQNSGTSKIDRIVNNQGGTINAGVLEMSNVDLTEEFTEMIVAQRGFQANSKIITTSDTIMDEIINLKR